MASNSKKTPDQLRNDRRLRAANPRLPGPGKGWVELVDQMDTGGNLRTRFLTALSALGEKAMEGRAPHNYATADELGENFAEYIDFHMARSMQRLHAEQPRCYDVLYWRYYRMRTVREVALILGYKSTSVVHKYEHRGMDYIWAYCREFDR